MRRSLKPWLLGITLAVAPAAVFAQQQPEQYPECTTTPTEADVSGAKGAFQAGQASFNEGDYARAITYWEDAFRRDCTAAALLLNLGRAYELNGQKPEAVNALKTYIKRKPASPQLDQIQKRIEVLEDKIAKEKQAPTATAPAGTGTAGASASTTAGSASASITATGAPPPPTTGGGKRPILPLIVAGGGGAVGIAGFIGFLVENGKVKDYESTCPRGTNPKTGKVENICPPGIDINAVQSAANSANTARNVWGGVGIAGGVIAVGGVVWYLLSPPEESTSALAAPKRRTVVTPELGRGYAGLSVSGAF